MSRAFELLEQFLTHLREELVREVREELAAKQVEAGRGDLLSVKEAAEVARVRPPTIRAWLASGALTRYGGGRVLRVSRAELLQHLGPSRAQSGRRTPEEEADELLQRRRGRRGRAGGGRTL